MDEMKTHCMLCPHACGADRTVAVPTGYCGMGWDVRIARAASHFWEEPCISGIRGSGTVFFVGCVEQCVYCQNQTISHIVDRKSDTSAFGFQHQGNGVGEIKKESDSGNIVYNKNHIFEIGRLPGHIVSTEELADVFLSLQDQGTHNINLVTPTQFSAQIAQALVTAKTNGLQIPVVYNTGGYEKIETLRMLDGLVDIYLTDFQHALPEMAKRYSGVEDYPQIAEAALREMIRQTGTVLFEQDMDADAYNAWCTEHETEEDYSGPLMKRGTIVRHLLLPGAIENARGVLHILRRVADDVGDTAFFLSLLNQYTPILADTDKTRFPELTHRVSEEEYMALVDEAEKRGFQNVFYQYGETASESFIPEFEGTAIM